MSNLMKTLTIGDASYEICDANAREALKNMVGQPDWNQNDPEASGYVKNRTHYDAGSPVEFPVFSGESMAFMEGMNFDQTATMYEYEMQESDVFALSVGNTYYVTIDGETFTVQGMNMGEATYIGNLGIGVSAYPNTGEPFFIMPDDGMFFLNIAGETHDISISEVRNVVEKELIPDNEYTFSVMNTDMLPMLINIGGFDLSSISEGDLCNVTFNGIDYTNTVVNDDGTLLFGNLAIMGAGENTGEPYLGVYVGMSGMYALTTTVKQQFSIDKVSEDSSYTNIVPDELYEFTYSDMGYMMAAGTDSGYILEADTTYKVIWNGTEYTCVSVSQNIGTEEEPVTKVYIGNLSKIGMSDTDSGEPFIFGYAAAEGFMSLFIADESFTDTHQIKVSGYVSGVKKLDKKYLPDHEHEIEFPIATTDAIGCVKIGSKNYNDLSTNNNYSRIVIDSNDKIYAESPTIQKSTTDLIAGESALASGAIYLVYE